jgi:hypothetical protein
MRAFVIRVWTPADDVEARVHQRCELRGVIEQVGSADATPFKNDRELLGVLRERLRKRAAPEGDCPGVATRSRVTPR